MSATVTYHGDLSAESLIIDQYYQVKMTEGLDSVEAVLKFTGLNADGYPNLTMGTVVTDGVVDDVDEPMLGADFYSQDNVLLDIYYRMAPCANNTAANMLSDETIDSIVEHSIGVPTANGGS